MLENTQARAGDPEILIYFFELFYSESHILNNIQLNDIYNIDETGFMMGYAASSKVIILVS